MNCLNCFRYGQLIRFGLCEKCYFTPPVHREYRRRAEESARKDIEALKRQVERK